MIESEESIPDTPDVDVSPILTLFTPRTCPNCHSPDVTQKHLARQVGGIVGTTGGAASGIAGALAGAETGAALGLVAGPVGITLGTLAGALMGGLIGAATGGIAGAKLGSLIDERVLKHYQCMRCGHTFTEH